MVDKWAVKIYTQFGSHVPLIKQVCKPISLIVIVGTEVPQIPIFSPKLPLSTTIINKHDINKHNKVQQRNFSALSYMKTLFIQHMW